MVNDNINTSVIIILSFGMNKFSHILTHRTISNDSSTMIRNFTFTTTVARSNDERITTGNSNVILK